jgi:hypothetical protein
LPHALSPCLCCLSSLLSIPKRPHLLMSHDLSLYFLGLYLYSKTTACSPPSCTSRRLCSLLQN